MNKRCHLHMHLHADFICVQHSLTAPRQLTFISLVNLLIASYGNKTVQHISKIAAITCTVIFELSLFSFGQKERKSNTEDLELTMKAVNILNVFVLAGSFLPAGLCETRHEGKSFHKCDKKLLKYVFNELLEYCGFSSSVLF